MCLIHTFPTLRAHTKQFGIGQRTMHKTCGKCDIKEGKMKQTCSTWPPPLHSKRCFNTHLREEHGTKSPHFPGEENKLVFCVVLGFAFQLGLGVSPTLDCKRVPFHNALHGKKKMLHPPIHHDALHSHSALPSSCVPSRPHPPATSGLIVKRNADITVPS